MNTRVLLSSPSFATEPVQETLYERISRIYQETLDTPEADGTTHGERSLRARFRRRWRKNGPNFHPLYLAEREALAKFLEAEKVRKAEADLQQKLDEARLP